VCVLPALLFQAHKATSLPYRRVENTVNLDDIIIEQALHLDHRTRLRLST
jgi:hypothetical protein